MHQTTGPIQLCPKQAEALHCLISWRGQTPILHISSADGFGKSEVLREFQRKTDAHWVDIRQFVSDVATRHPLAMQDSLWQLLLMAIKEHSTVIVDDFNLFFDYATGCSGSPRGSYHETAAKALLLEVTSKRGQLVLGSKQSRTAYNQSAKRAMDVNVNRPRWFNVHPELFDTCEQSEECL